MLYTPSVDIQTRCPDCSKPSGPLLCWYCDWVADQRAITKVQDAHWDAVVAREAAEEFDIIPPTMEVV